MCIDAHISGGARQTLVFPVLYVLARLCVNVLLGQPKVNDVDDVFARHMMPPHQEVLRLHVTVDQVFIVHVFNSCNLHRERRKNRNRNNTENK